MKLTKENIQYIEQYLILKGIKYMDVRMELIDHLSTDFEENSNYVLLEDFLKTRTTFISEFKKKRQTRLHWSYQKQLWMQFFKIFYTVIGLVKMATIVLLLLLGLQLFEIRTVALTSLITAGLINFGSMFIHFNQRKAIGKLQSSVLIFGILSFPALPLYCYGQINLFIESYSVVFVMFWTIVLLLNIEGAEAVYNLKKTIVGNYNKLMLA